MNAWAERKRARQVKEPWSPGRCVKRPTETHASAYTNGGCRCAACREAHSNVMRELRIRRTERLARNPGLAVHGNESTYQNHGCRCNHCRAARATRQGARREEQRRWAEEYRARRQWAPWGLGDTLDARDIDGPPLDPYDQRPPLGSPEREDA